MYCVLIGLLPNLELSTAHADPVGITQYRLHSHHHVTMPGRHVIGRNLSDRPEYKFKRHLRL
jgi:hypothetical protein